MACLCCCIFRNYLVNYTIFWGKNMFDMKCVFLFSLHLRSELFSHSRKNSAIIIVSKSYKVTYVAVPLNQIWIFSTNRSKRSRYTTFPKLRPAEAEFHAGGWTDMAKLIVAFRSVANAPKNCNSSRYFDCIRTFEYNDVEYSIFNSRKETLLKVV
jgi:hypothetical protein